ncbi:MAG: molybdate ABC transporter permease subunit [Planctomycetota bacterium]|nr:MAG: molybdate ABC transporter permease subunit [Planctomycetota bacterium]
MTSSPFARSSAPRHRSWSHKPSIWVVALAVVGLAFLALPIVALLIRAIESGALMSALAGRAVLDALILSLSSTAVSLTIVIVVGTPLAFVLARTTFRGKALAEALVDLPIVLPPSVAGLALLFAYGRNGIAGESLEVFGITLPFTTLAVIVAQVFVASPFYIRAARSGFRSITPEVEEAARVDGASENAVLGRITLPLAGPALGAGLVLAWARALGEFGATILFAGNIEGRTQTLPLLVYSEFQDSLDAAMAAATILVLAALGVLIAVRLMRWPSGVSWFN